jgi:PEP-CTERM motif
MRISKQFLLSAVAGAFGALIATDAAAVIYPNNYEVTFVGTNDYSVPSPGGSGNWTCEAVGACSITKDFTALGSIPVVIDVIPNTSQDLLTSPDLLHLDETIMNDTGSDWTNFEFGFIGIDNGAMTVDFQNVVFDSFTQSTAATDALSLTGGGVSNGDSFSVSFDLLLNTRPGDYNLFAISEQPSVPSIPEPGTIALLGIGLAGLGVGRRRRTR